MTLIYDVETTGIPDWKKPSNDPCQPHIIQISAIRIDEEGKEIERINHLIKPDGWIVPDDIIKLTGITNERLDDEGIPILQAVNIFIEIWRKCKLTVAHNDDFDRRLFRIEMGRLFGKVELLEEWKNFPKFCTMRESSHITKIPPTPKMIAAGFVHFKPPKLQELYKFFFDKEPDKSHDAMADVESTLACYLKLKEREVKTA